MHAVEYLDYQTVLDSASASAVLLVRLLTPLITVYRDSKCKRSSASPTQQCQLVVAIAWA